MGSPHVLHELELLPLNPSSYNAQPVCVRRNSHPAHGTLAWPNAQPVLRMSEGYQIAESMRAGACIDVNQLPSSSESQDEFAANEEAPFILGLSAITKTSANGRKRASSDPKSGATNPEPTKVSYFEHVRMLDDVSQRASEEEGVSIARKKLRLSKEDSAILEERFKEHSTLNPNQKIALAKQLNLRPRQVEVWFQNRRARTKLKQIEVDCEALKRCCEALSEENKRLEKEIVELRALIPHDFYMPLPGTTLTMCPSCQCLAPQSVVAQTTSTTTSISSFNQPSTIPLTFSSHQQLSPDCS